MSRFDLFGTIAFAADIDRANGSFEHVGAKQLQEDRLVGDVIGRVEHLVTSKASDSVP